MLRRLSGLSPLRLAGLFTHFSDPVGDPARTMEQLQAFDELVASAGDAVPGHCIQHVASTAALLRHRRFHRAMVRFGLAWAGYGDDELEGSMQDPMAAWGPSGGLGLGGPDSLHAHSAHAHPLHASSLDASRLEPCLTWSSRLVQVREVDAGTPVGYGSRWTARRRSILGLVPVGYGDGLPRALPSVDSGRPAGPSSLTPAAATVAVRGEAPRGHALPRRAFAPIVGVVNMDQITIDLTDAVASGVPVAVGTRVELISPDPRLPNHLPRLAAAAGTIPHELLCRISAHARRSYVVDAAPALLLEEAQVASAG